MDVTKKNKMTFSFMKLEIIATLEQVDMGSWVNLGQVKCQMFADSDWVFGQINFTVA